MQSVKQDVLDGAVVTDDESGADAMSCNAMRCRDDDASRWRYD